MRSFLIIIIIGVSAFTVFSCGEESEKNSYSALKAVEALGRPYRMGFSPWLNDDTVEAQNWVYERINREGDIISHHLEEGVPWPESYSGSLFSTSYENELTARKDRLVTGKKIVLQINPLNGGRDGMALYRGNSINESLPSPWDGYSLDSTQVKTAFLNYAVRMITYFEPDYLLIGVEVNLLVRNNPAIWPQYLSLHRHLYTELKSLYPSLPVSVSVFCVPYFPEWSGTDNLEAQMNALADITPYVDFISLSVHPFMSGLLAEVFPDNYFSRLFSITAKPIAISESSYPAQVWSTLSPPILTFNGTEDKQKNFLSLMLRESKSRGAYFIIWFSIRDYDALWNGALGQSEDSLIWRDTGLYSEDGSDRKAVVEWRNMYSLPCYR